MKNIRLLSALHLSLLIVGCASSGARPSPSWDPDVLTETEIREFLQYNAAQVIRELRPSWFNDRGGRLDPLGVRRIVTPKGIRVYVDGVGRSNGLGALEMIVAEEIHEMRRLDASEATQRFGLGHTSGAILVTTIR